MPETAIPLPDDPLSPGLYREHPLFSNDMGTVVSYAGQVLDRYGLPTETNPAPTQGDQIASVELGVPVTFLCGDVLEAWVAKQSADDSDAWEVAYAYSLINLVHEIENELHDANSSIDRECGVRQLGMPGYTNAGLSLANATMDQGRRLGDLLARWRLFWRYGPTIRKDKPSALIELLWHQVVSEDEAPDPRSRYELASFLELECTKGTPLGLKLRAASFPSRDHAARTISRLMTAFCLGKAPNP